jgi:hypothetical protein
MKRYLRCCLIFLFALALPLSGMASFQAPIEPCPMKAAGVAMTGDMGQDCCYDIKSPSDHSKPCKPGQGCKSGSVLQVLIVKPVTRFTRPMRLFLFSDFLPTYTPSGVWRPPRI